MPAYQLNSIPDTNDVFPIGPDIADKETALDIFNRSDEAKKTGIGPLTFDPNCPPADYYLVEWVGQTRAEYPLGKAE